jgi:hypothetical protein
MPFIPFPAGGEFGEEARRFKDTLTTSERKSLRDFEHLDKEFWQAIGVDTKGTSREGTKLLYLLKLFNASPPEIKKETKFFVLNMLHEFVAIIKQRASQAIPHTPSSSEAQAVRG